MKEKIIKPVAIARTGFNEKFGIPRQSGRAPSAVGRIEFVKEYADKSAIKGIEGFSHLWLVFGFNRTEYNGALTVRPPRLGGNVYKGVFATRSPNRPNGLGLSVVKLEDVLTANGVTLLVSGIDLADGTPIYDIKPYHPYADAIAGAKGGYIEDCKDHKLSVVIPPELAKDLSDEIKRTVTECLSDDPRPGYKAEGDREYGMNYSGYNIKFTVANGVATVKSIEKNSV